VNLFIVTVQKDFEIGKIKWTSERQRTLTKYYYQVGKIAEKAVFRSV